ncbi:hypothetical protein Tco_0053473 [Tanacetum coccineum]
MHNNIMAAGLRDRQPMLTTGRCVQWRSWAVPATENSPAIPEQTTVETVLNMSLANKAHFESEKEAIHLILTGSGDEIYSTVDTFNVQFLQQLQPEWSRFVTIVKQKYKLDEVSYHKLFDILKQYQKEVNELRAERIARNANPLALIAKPITPPSELASDEDSDPEQAQKDKEMQKNLALIAKYFKKLYKPTNNNLRTIQTSKPKTKIDEQELEAHYSYMAKIRKVPNADSGTDSEPLEQIVQLILFIVDSGCTKHVTGNISILFGVAFENLLRILLEIFRETIYSPASDYDNPDPAPELQNVSPSPDTTVPSQQELDLLFGPLYDDFFNDGTSRVNKSSSPTDNSAPQDTHPSTNIHPTSEPTTQTNVHAEENNDNQAEFTNPFCTPVHEHAESSSCNIGNLNVHTDGQNITR